MEEDVDAVKSAKDLDGDDEGDEGDDKWEDLYRH